MGAEQGQHCSVCAEGLKEVGGFLKFKKGGEKQKRNCAYVTIFSVTGSLFTPVRCWIPPLP